MRRNRVEAKRNVLDGLDARSTIALQTFWMIAHFFGERVSNINTKTLQVAENDFGLVLLCHKRFVILWGAATPGATAILSAPKFISIRATLGV